MQPMRKEAISDTTSTTTTATLASVGILQKEDLIKELISYIDFLLQENVDLHAQVKELEGQVMMQELEKENR